MAFINAPEDQLMRDVATLRQVLRGELQQTQPLPSSQPCLVVLSGLPGTGKSHFAAELVKQVPFLVLGSDRLRKVLVHHPKYTRDEHIRVFAASHRLIEEFLTEGRRVIFDATNLTERFRQPLYDITDRLGVPLVLVWLTAPCEVIWGRLADRSAGLRSDSYSDADWLIYCRLRPGEEPIMRPHFTVDSSGDISPAVSEVVRVVKTS